MGLEFGYSARRNGLDTSKHKRHHDYTRIRCVKLYLIGFSGGSDGTTSISIGIKDLHMFLDCEVLIKTLNSGAEQNEIAGILFDMRSL
ncbi:hypothetical protein AALP_AA6G201400, partial [Arabis alpina]